MKHIPWVEKYRPTKFNNIVLDEYNKIILENIVKKRYFPNLLFYGPPGTGKTTTVINIIKKYQERYEENYKELVIHLNASDERGIEVIRNQIHSFVNSKNLFGKGKKFVILDEIDHMTKNAQEALKSLINDTKIDVCFFLICNYISKIDPALQNILLKLRFNQLPKNEIINFLREISSKELLDITTEMLETIQTIYKSDMRSMINYLQLNQDNLKSITNDNKLTMSKLYSMIKNNDKNDILKKIKKTAIDNKIENKDLIKKLFTYIIENCLSEVKNIDALLRNSNFIIHNLSVNEDYLLNYVCIILKEL